MWGGQKYHLKEPASIEKLTNTEGIITATHDMKTLVAQTEVRDPNSQLKAIIEYPIKTMNTNNERPIFQVDTGPVVYPEFDTNFDQIVESLFLGFIGFNNVGVSEAILDVPTPIWYRKYGNSVFNWMTDNFVHHRVLSFALSPLLGLNRETGSQFHFATGSRRRLSLSLKRVADAVYTVSPLLPVPNRYAKRRPSIVFTSVRRFVKRAVARLNIKDPLVWSYSPFGTAYLPEMIDPAGFVYDCVDRYDQLEYYTSYCIDISAYQERVFAASDIVFVTSEPIYDMFSDRHATVELIGNAADIALFETAHRGGEATVAPELRDVSGPIVGFYGVLSENKIDFDLLERLVKRIPKLILVLIGPVKMSLPTWVDNRSDVVRIPRKPQHELPGYLTAFDVCLLPYKMNEYTKGIEPLKLYEYLAAGKPVVATPFADLPDLGDWLRIASAGESFIRTVGSTIETPPKSPLPDVSDRDWNAKVRRMVSVLVDEGVVRDTLQRTSSESTTER